MKFAICLMALVVCTFSGEFANAVHMADEPTEADPNSDLIKRKAELILQHYDDSNTFGLAQRVRSVKSAKTQVVAGKIYDMVIDMGLMDCTEAQAKKANSKCKITKAADCQFKMWEREWLNSYEIQSAVCGEFITLKFSGL